MYASVEWCATTDDYRRLRLWNWIKLNVYFQQDVAMETIQTKIRYPLLLFNIHTLITFTSYYDTRSYRERWWSDQDESNWIVFFLNTQIHFSCKTMNPKIFTELWFRKLLLQNWLPKQHFSSQFSVWRNMDDCDGYHGCTENVILCHLWWRWTPNWTYFLLF